jgi:hypothetical protein
MARRRRFLFSGASFRLIWCFPSQVKDPRFFADTVFVFAADYAFYASLRAVIVGVREKFASKAKMVVYDLGGLSSHQNSVRALFEGVKLKSHLPANRIVFDLQSGAAHIQLLAAAPDTAQIETVCLESAHSGCQFYPPGTKI